MTSYTSAAPATYLNPVYEQTFADPFVLKYRGHYWAYCTGLQPDGKAFGILESPDLVNWRRVNSAMLPLPGDHPCYWAPEVTYDNGLFFLYYSVGNETTMHLRVALADHPTGPFIDSGRQLTLRGEEGQSEHGPAMPFAIDPHVFTDDNGRRYLFYATDFYNRTRVGTGTVRDRLLDPFTLAGHPQPVTLPGYDWQVYDAEREEKGGVRWHTVEGPFVTKYKGKYYQMFSGGNWKNPSYGVGYGLTGDIERNEEWNQMCDGDRVPPILQTAPDAVHGPGHNSVVRSPNNMQQYCVYHRWGNGEGRQMAIDTLDWAGERMFILGPSHTPQSAPAQAYFADFLWKQTSKTPAPAWNCNGDWVVRDGAAMPRESGTVSKLEYKLPTTAFVTEVSAAGPAERSTGGSWGMTLHSETELMLKLRLIPAAQAVIITWRSDQGLRKRLVALPPAFNFAAYHLLRLEVDGLRVRLSLDDTLVTWEATLAKPAHSTLATFFLGLYCQEIQAAFAGFALTPGWQQLFMTEGSAEQYGWHGDAEHWRVGGRRLFYHGSDTGRLYRGPFLEAYELTVNACLEKDNGEDACYGFLPALTAEGIGLLLTIRRQGASWRLIWADGDIESSFPLPAEFEPSIYQQFRFRKEKNRLFVCWEGHDIAVGPVSPAATQVGLFAQRARVGFDMVRVTALTERNFVSQSDIELGEPVAARQYL